jgi:hypothetical protein
MNWWKTRQGAPSESVGSNQAVRVQARPASQRENGDTVLPCKSPSQRTTLLALSELCFIWQPPLSAHYACMIDCSCSTLSSAHHRPDPGRANSMPMDRGANARSTPRKVAVASCCCPPNNSRIETALVLSHKSQSLTATCIVCVFSLSGVMCDRVHDYIVRACVIVHDYIVIGLTDYEYRRTPQKERLGTQTSKNEALS